MYVFGELLKQFRKRDGISQEELALRVGVTRNTVSAWEGSQYSPKEQERVLKLSEVLSLDEVDTDNLLVAAKFPQKYQTQKTTEQWRYEAHLLISGGNYKDALVAYKEILRIGSHNAYIYYETGEVHYHLKTYEEALNAFEQAIHFDPSNASAYNYKGETLYQLQHYEEALESFKKATHLEPSRATYYFNTEKTLRQLQHYAEALQVCRQAIRLDSTNAFFYNELGQLLRISRRYEEALAAHEQAISLNPNLADAHFGKGLALRWLGRYKEELSAYEQTLRLDPYASVHHYLTSVLIHLGRSEEAEQVQKASQQLRTRNIKPFEN